MRFRESERQMLKIVAVYAAVSAAWIAWSDHALVALVRDPDALGRFEMLKGGFFVLATSFLLYAGMRRQFSRLGMAMDSLRELNRAHRMIAACQSAMIRARDRRELFDEICRIAVEDGGYLFSWVGLAQDDERRSVRAAAAHGRTAEHLKSIPVDSVVWAADVPVGNGPTGGAIRTGELSQWTRGIAPDPGPPWSEAVARFGIRVGIGLPLRTGGRTVGSWTLFSERGDQLDPAETALLRKLSASISFALEKLDQETAQTDRLDQLRALDRTHRMVSAAHQTMLHSRSREELFDEICRVGVEEGGYLLAWVGLVRDDAERSVLPVSRWGKDEGYLDSARIAAADVERGRGPTGTAIRSGTLCVGGFSTPDPRLAPWREAALARGFRSAIALPLRAGGRTIGALTMYSERRNPFDAAEKTLLESLADSISFALEALDRRATETRLVENLRKLSHAVEQSPVSIVITDARGRIEYVNRRFSEVSGYAPDEVLGRNPSVLKSGETPAETYAAMWTAIAAGQVWQGEFANKAKDGTPFWEWATVSPLRDDDGRITHYVAVKEDITAKRALELQLRHAQKMETIGTLAGGIAHDFNNILTVIQGHCSLLELAKLPGELDRESVSEIQTSVERAAALTRQLLAFGRRQPMQARRMDLSESAGKMTRLLRRVIPERVALEAALPAEPLPVHADPAMIDQVVMNLVLNARDAIAGKGRILIETAVAEGAAPPVHAADRGHGWVVMRVTDDGCGIQERDFARIFEPFYTTKPTGKGTGLGLAVVDGIVRQHKGWVTVASEVGKGATFSVYLPREVPDATSASVTAPASTPCGTETILLAEDEAPLRRLVARGLTALGYKVLEAATGEGAEDLWRRQDGPIRLLITDMVMPGAFGGDELARRLRETSPDLAVIYISGYHTSPLGGTLGLARRSAFLQKPFKPDELGRLVRQVLDSR